MIAEPQDIETPGDDLLNTAWVVIANASDWILEGNHSTEWVEAAKRWRDAYHRTLGIEKKDT